MKFSIRMFILTLGLFPAALFGAQISEKPVELNLQTVLQIAATRSPEAIASSERVKQAAARLGQAASRYLPQVSLTVSESRQTRNLKANGIILPGQSNPLVGPFNSFDARMSVTQTIFDWETVERIRSVSATREISMAEHEKTRQDMMSLAAVLFLDAVRSEKKSKVQKISYYEKKQSYQVIREKWAAGAASLVEKEQALRDAQQSRYLLDQVRRDADENRLNLLAMLGIPLDQTVSFVSDSELPEVETPESSDSDQFVLKLPEVKAAEAELMQAQAEKRAAYARYLPGVSGVMDYGLSGSDPSDSKKTYTLGVKASWPVFEGGQTLFKNSETRSAEREVRVKLDHLREEKKAAARIAAENLIQMQHLKELKQQEFDVAAREFEMSKTRLQTGDGNRQAWIRAFALKRAAEDELDEAHAASLAAQIQMLHATGQMDLWLPPEKEKV